MELISGIKARRSIRKFKADTVDHGTLASIVEAASFAPSWKNAQIARYLVVEDKAVMADLADNCVMGFTYNANIMKAAPALVVITYIKGRSGFERDGSFTTSKGDRWEMFDAGIAAQTFCLAAHAHGVGTVIMGIFDDAEIEKRLGIPEERKVAAVLAIGYPNEEPNPPKRKTVEELLSFYDA